MADDIREVFISYHEKSAGEFVAELADKLESAGISCWYAKRDLPSGKSFADCIPHQIKNCKVFLLILNVGANHSKHIGNEMTLAFRRLNNEERITILPYQIEKCAFADWLDYYLAQIQIKSAESMDIGALATEVAHKLGREPVKNGRCGQTRWRFKNGVLTISKPDLYSEAKMGDFYHQYIPECVNTPWWSEHEKITAVIIKDGVKNIGECAFRNCSNLVSANIPDTITSIGWDAFYGCRSLREIYIPDSVTRIGPAAFDKCDSLMSVSIPMSTKIWEGLFDSFGPHTQVIRRPAK